MRRPRRSGWRSGETRHWVSTESLKEAHKCEPADKNYEDAADRLAEVRSPAARPAKTLTIEWANAIRVPFAEHRAACLTDVDRLLLADAAGHDTSLPFLTHADALILTRRMARITGPQVDRLDLARHFSRLGAVVLNAEAALRTQRTRRVGIRVVFQKMDGTCADKYHWERSDLVWNHQTDL